MRFEWDEKKRKENIKNHGLDFAEHMNAANFNKPSETDWARVDSMTDERIDTSEIPPLTDEFFAKAKWRMPGPSVPVTVQIEPDVLEWFKSQGNEYNRLMSAALRIYAEAHKSSVGQ